MPLEISEIGIRLSVGEPAGKAARRGDAGPGPSGSAARGAALTPQQVEALVETCVRRVLDTLRAMGER